MHSSEEFPNDTGETLCLYIVAPTLCLTRIVGGESRVEDEVEVRFGLKMAYFVILGWRCHHLGRLPGNCGGWPM